MRSSSRLIVMIALFVLLAVGVVGLAYAQDATATTDTSTTSGTGTTGMIQCDADLIQNLFIAQHFFGFDQVASQMATNGADTSGMVDLNTIDKGQYTPWFNAPMTGTGPWSPDQINTVSSLLAMDDATLQSTLMQGQDTSTLTALQPVTVAGEPAECTQLRTELNRFFSVLAYGNFSGMLTLPSSTGGTSSSGTGSSGTGSTDVTPEATTSANG